MKWFRHDSDAHVDGKIRKLILRHGPEGYAVYFHCLELIAGKISKEKITFELEHDSEVIADNLKIRGDQQATPAEKVTAIMNYILELDLFQEDSGRIFCLKMAARLDSSMVKNPQLLEVKKQISGNFAENQGKSAKSVARLDQIRSEKKRVKDLAGKPARGGEKQCGFTVDRFIAVFCEEFKNKYKESYKVEKEVGQLSSKVRGLDEIRTRRLCQAFFSSKDEFVSKNQSLSWLTSKHVWNRKELIDARMEQEETLAEIAERISV